MLGAQSAIERAAAFGFDTELRHLAGDGVFEAIVLRGIGADVILAHAMLWTLFAKVHSPRRTMIFAGTTFKHSGHRLCVVPRKV